MAAWRAWNVRSAQRYLRLRLEEIGLDELRKQNREDPMPPVPTDNDFKIVDGRMDDDDDC